MRPRILIAESEGMSPDAIAMLSAVGDVTLADLSRSELLEAVSDVDVLWVRLRTRIDADMIGRASQLAIIATPTTGLDHVDLRAASDRGIRVVSLRGETEFLKDVRATAELTLALMLSVLRQIPAASRDVVAGNWNRDAFKGRELYRKTVGIVGYGRLGRLVAGYVRVMGAEVIAYDVRDDVEHDVERVSFTELLERADLVSIHVSLDDSTRGMFDASAFARMKRGAYLVNTARGEVVDSDALLDALRGGRLAGAALDVVAGERATGVAALPLAVYAKSNSNVVITPHIGGCTFESMSVTEKFLAERVVGAWRALRPPSTR